MTKTQQQVLEELEARLRTVDPPTPTETPSIEEQQLQQQGNDPVAFDFELKRLQNDRFENENEHWKTIYELRKEYIPKLYFMIVYWLIVVAAFVFLTGYSAENINNPDCQINCTRFKLSDNVLIAFITTTTATVIGVFIIVAKWLFPAPLKEESSEKKEEKK